MKRVNRPIWIMILVIAVLAVLFGVFFLLRYMTQNDQLITRDDVTTAAQPTAAPTSDETAAAQAPTAAPTQAPTVNSFGYKMDSYEDWTTLSFDELMEVNSDIYAWIYIPGTNVDYPVAQSANGDDNFYLSHNVYREYQFSGTIYSQSMNKTDFTDPVTVLYGHNMLNGSMFATLHYFSDREFFDSHTTCFVQTKDKLLTYLIYSAYVYDDRHIMNSFNFDDEEVLLDFFDSTLNPRTYSGNVREGIELTKDSRILTLSTCTNGASNTRYLVQGVLVDEQLRQ